MATYQFSFITSVDAAGYAAASDDLRFDGISGATATGFTVTGASSLTIRLTATGGSVVLGQGAAGDVLTMPDGSKLGLPASTSDAVTGGAAGDHLYGGAGNDVLSGLAGGDQLDGGSFADTLDGGTGADTLTGGELSDAFMFAPGDSGVAAGQLDVITDFTFGDTIRFSTPMTGGGFLTVTANSYEGALEAANREILSGAADIVAAQVGNDTFVFADTRNDNGTADDAIKLANRGLGSVQATSFQGFTSGGGPGPNQPGPGPVTPAPSTGTVTFETVSQAAALGYNAATNDLQFTAPRAGNSATLVFFDAGGTVTLISGAESQNRSVTFGAGIYGESGLIFPDGTRVAIGSPGDDLLRGAHTHDSLYGGPGADTLNGGGNPDRLSGGTGADLFVAEPRDTSASIHDVVSDWEAVDRITFGGSAGATSATYVELDGGGQAEAEARIRSGAADFVAYQATDPLGTIVHVYADAFGTNTPSGHIALRGATLAMIDFSNIVASPLLAFPALAPVPGTATTAAPGPVTYVGGERATNGALIEGSMDNTALGDVSTGEVVDQGPTIFHLTANNGVSIQIQGNGFTYREDATAIYDITGGTISSIQLRTPNLYVNTGGSGVTPSQVFNWIVDGAVGEAFQVLFAGANQMQGAAGADLLRGLGGSDTLGGFGGADTLWGGQGDDVIYAGNIPGRSTLPVTGSTYLRGEEGNDWIGGGTGFDDINGNMGNDTAGGGMGDDWVVGGKDSDLLFGDAGADLVYGNLGSDTCEGGEGNDIIRGGQDNDIVRGGAGDDYVSGDRGDDTMTGDAGADIFHSFGEAGIDRVTDFSLAQGDRVQLDPGTQYTVAQVGADTVISMTGGGQMTLVGVPMSSLTPGWIFGA